MISLHRNIRNMGRETVIVIENDETLECWGSLKRLCEDPEKGHSEFVFNTIRRKKFPFEYKGWRCYKVRFNDRQYYAKKVFKE